MKPEILEDQKVYIIPDGYEIEVKSVCDCELNTMCGNATLCMVCTSQGKHKVLFLKKQR